MATDKFPQQNVNMPMDPKRVEMARERLAPPRSFVPDTLMPQNGKGSRREIRKGEWIDDRVIPLDGGPASPSSDTPPPLAQVRDVPPATYDATKVYSIKLGKAATFAGRVLSPARDYRMTGETCTQINTDHPGAIMDAVVLGDLPVRPDTEPSAAPEATKAKKKA